MAAVENKNSEFVTFLRKREDDHADDLGNSLNKENDF